MRTGDWTSDQEAIYQAMFNDDGSFTGVVPTDIKATFPTIKPHYFGPQLTSKGPSLPFSLKFSLSPIIPTMTNIRNSQGIKVPNDLEILMNQMTEDRVDVVLFPSAAKIGHKVNKDNLAPPLYDFLPLTGTRRNLRNEGLGQIRKFPKGHYNTIYLILSMLVKIK